MIMLWITSRAVGSCSFLEALIFSVYARSMLKFSNSFYLLTAILSCALRMKSSVASELIFGVYCDKKAKLLILLKLNYYKLEV